MKLLIVTQTIDRSDDLLGFMDGWIKEFAKHCQRVTAIGLGVGAHEYPDNVHVLSLGKENGGSRSQYTRKFLRYVVQERKNYDVVFVHMNPEYVVLGGPLWKLMGKKIGLWYAHGQSSRMLRAAHQMTDLVFTTNTEGFSIPSPKRRIVGHGIDCERFSIAKRGSRKPFRVLTVGRISPIKDLETLVRAFAELSGSAVLEIVGAPALRQDRGYLESLKRLTAQLSIIDRVHFLGSIPNDALQPIYARADLFVNTSRTGSFDKTVGEAMATGFPVLTSNPAFREVLPKHAARLMFDPGDSSGLLRRMKELSEMSIAERKALGLELRTIVEEEHSLSTLASRVLAHYAPLSSSVKCNTSDPI